MKGPFKMPLSSLQDHPRKSEVCGDILSEATYESIKNSMMEHGPLLPLIITPPTAIDHPLCILKGRARARIGREIGSSVFLSQQSIFGERTRRGT